MLVNKALSWSSYWASVKAEYIFCALATVGQARRVESMVPWVEMGHGGVTGVPWHDGKH